MKKICRICLPSYLPFLRDRMQQKIRRRMSRRTMARINPMNQLPAVYVTTATGSVEMIETIRPYVYSGVVQTIEMININHCEVFLTMIYEPLK